MTEDELSVRLAELEREREEARRRSSDPTLAISLSMSMLASQLLDEVMKSRPLQLGFIAVTLLVTLVVTRRRRSKSNG